MQVLARSFDVMAVLASTWPLGKRDAFIALAGLADKMADIKLKGPAGDALTALSEACGPQFVCTQLHKKAAAHKNPKVRPDMSHTQFTYRCMSHRTGHHCASITLRCQVACSSWPVLVCRGVHHHSWNISGKKDLRADGLRIQDTVMSWLNGSCDGSSWSAGAQREPGVDGEGNRGVHARRVQCEGAVRLDEGTPQHALQADSCKPVLQSSLPHG